jgi:hypothetical protein
VAPSRRLILAVGVLWQLREVAHCER